MLIFYVEKVLVIGLPEIHAYLISRCYSNRENQMYTKYSRSTVVLREKNQTNVTWWFVSEVKARDVVHLSTLSTCTSCSFATAVFTTREAHSRRRCECVCRNFRSYRPSELQLLFAVTQFTFLVRQFWFAFAVDC